MDKSQAKASKSSEDVCVIPESPTLTEDIAAEFDDAVASLLQEDEGRLEVVSVLPQLVSSYYSHLLQEQQVHEDEDFSKTLSEADGKKSSTVADGSKQVCLLCFLSCDYHVIVNSSLVLNLRPRS